MSAKPVSKKTKETEKAMPLYMCGQMKATVEGLSKTVAALSEDVKAQGDSLSRVERKVFNGFGSKIDNIQLQVINNKEANDKSHEEIKKAVSRMNTFIGTALIMIFVAVLGILGSLWIQNRQQTNNYQYTSPKVETNASGIESVK